MKAEGSRSWCCFGNSKTLYNKFKNADDQSEQGLVESIVGRGLDSDKIALSGIIALSERASHPVSKAVSSLAKKSSSLVEALPSTNLQKFQLVPGESASVSKHCWQVSIVNALSASCIMSFVVSFSESRIMGFR